MKLAYVLVLNASIFPILVVIVTYILRSIYSEIAL